jgi:hypothetical protein
LNGHIELVLKAFFKYGSGKTHLLS